MNDELSFEISLGKQEKLRFHKIIPYFFMVDSTIFLWNIMRVIGLQYLERMLIYDNYLKADSIYVGGIKEADR